MRLLSTLVLLIVSLNAAFAAGNYISTCGNDESGTSIYCSQLRTEVKDFRIVDVQIRNCNANYYASKLANAVFFSSSSKNCTIN